MKYKWGSNRRFNAYANYCKKTYGERLQKLTIDAGFTCPNRDGTTGYGGCTYCVNDAFNPSYCTSSKSISQQLNEGIEFHKKRYRRANKYIAYFQAFTNTHAPLNELKDIYQQALSHKNIVGISIGTRPDCVDEEKLEYFRKLSKDYIVNIEYGIESCYDKTLERINRGHDFQKSAELLKLTDEMNLHAGVHLIFGLPGESREEMLEEANILSGLPVKSAKFHQLQILKGTEIEKEYNLSPEDFNLFSMPDYIEFIIDFIEKLTPDIAIERLAGEVPPRFLAGPGWGLIRNDRLLSIIEKRMEERNTWQGRLFA